VRVGALFHVSTFEADGREGRPVTLVAIVFLWVVDAPGRVTPSPSERDRVPWVSQADVAGYSLLPYFASVVP
jgi:hypothetical protein